MQFTPVSSTPSVSAGSLANLNVDRPSYTARFAASTVSIIVDLGAGASYDYVALSGCNLRATDTVQIQTGTTTTGTGSYTGSALPAYTGYKNPDATTDAIFKLSSTRGERYLRLDISSPSNPNGYIEGQRLIVGKSFAAPGISQDAEISFVDQSEITTGANWTLIDEYPVITAWNLRLANISEGDWRCYWSPFLQWAGKKKCFLFIPDDANPNLWQTDAIFGRIENDAKGKWEYFNYWAWEGRITELAP
jgi:ribosomal protein L31